MSEHEIMLKELGAQFDKHYTKEQQALIALGAVLASQSSLPQAEREIADAAVLAEFRKHWPHV